MRWLAGLFKKNERESFSDIIEKNTLYTLLSDHKDILDKLNGWAVDIISEYGKSLERGTGLIRNEKDLSYQKIEIENAIVYYVGISILENEIEKAQMLRNAYSLLASYIPMNDEDNPQSLYKTMKPFILSEQDRMGKKLNHFLGTEDRL